MGTTNPPDGWAVQTGTWGTDFDQSASERVTGAYSLKFIGTTPNPADDPVIAYQYIPVQAGKPYVSEITLKAESITAGYHIDYRVQWYTAAKVYISHDSVMDDECDVADTWETRRAVMTAPATASFARLRLAKNKQDFDVYVDNVSFKEHVYAFMSYYAGDPLDVGPAITYIIFDTEVYDYGGTYNTSDGKFTAPVSGVYSFASCLAFDEEIADTKYAQSAFYVNRTTRYYSSTIINGTGGAFAPFVTNSLPNIYLNRGDYVEVQIVHSHTEARLLSVGVTDVWFSGALVE